MIDDSERKYDGYPNALVLLYIWLNKTFCLHFLLTLSILWSQVSLSKAKPQWSWPTSPHQSPTYLFSFPPNTPPSSSPRSRSWNLEECETDAQTGPGHSSRFQSGHGRILAAADTTAPHPSPVHPWPAAWWCHPCEIGAWSGLRSQSYARQSRSPSPTGGGTRSSWTLNAVTHTSRWQQKEHIDVRVCPPWPFWSRWWRRLSGVWPAAPWLRTGSASHWSDWTPACFQTGWSQTGCLHSWNQNKRLRGVRTQ